MADRRHHMDRKRKERSNKRMPHILFNSPHRPHAQGEFYCRKEATLVIGYCDYHLITNIGYCDYFPMSRFQMPCLPCLQCLLRCVKFNYCLMPIVPRQSEYPIPSVLCMLYYRSLPIFCTGLPAYSDTGYSDTVRSSFCYSDTFLSPYLDLHTIKLFGYSDTLRSSPLTMTLFAVKTLSL